MGEVAENHPQNGRSALAAGALMTLAVIAAHLPRAFFDLPLYSSDEGAYLIRALHGHSLQSDPLHAPFVAGVDNAVFFWIVRLFSLLPEPAGLDVLRLAGGLTYIAGLTLAWRGVSAGLSRHQGLGLLLLALAYPYYRFAFTAMPEGWYVGLVGGMILATAALWRTRPILHAGLFGALGAMLTLVKPHGVAVMSAGAVLVLADLLLDRNRRPLLAALRLAVMGAAFLILGHLARWIETQAPPQQLLFFGQGFYAGVLETRPLTESPRIALTALYGMVMSAMLLAGPPAALGVDDLLRRRRADGFRPSGADLAFLMTLAGLAATIGMVAVFAYKISAVSLSETYRLWGRYFEFWIPLLWITGWPAILRTAELPDRRLLSAGVCFAGLIGLTITLHVAVTLFPWDVAALHAFFSPTDRFTGSRFPSFAIAATAMLGAMLLMLRGAAIRPVWQGVFGVLAALAIGQDGAWLSELLPARRILAAEAERLERAVPSPSERMIAFVDDANLHHNLFLSLDGRPRMVLLPPGAAVASKEAAGYSLAIVQRGHSVEGRGWRLVQQGQAFSVYRPKQ